MGEKRGPIEAYDDWTHSKASFSDGNWTYRQDGAWAGVPHGPDKLDLIEEWRDEPKSPIQEEVVTKRKLVPGVYGIVNISDGPFGGDPWFIGIAADKHTPEELEEASHILAQLAEFLREQE